MIKTPVKFVPYSDEPRQGRIIDADKIVIITLIDSDVGNQIVSALNAQQPKCETCGGMGLIQTDKSGHSVAPGITCPRCKGTGVEPDCQPPATPSGELVKNLRQIQPYLWLNENDHFIIEQAAARIETLEKANRWIPVSERLPEDGKVVMLFYVPFKSAHLGSWDIEEDRFLSYDGGCYYERKNITHWKPIILPAALKEQE